MTNGERRTQKEGLGEATTLADDPFCVLHSDVAVR